MSRASSFFCNSHAWILICGWLPTIKWLHANSGFVESWKNLLPMIRERERGQHTHREDSNSMIQNCKLIYWNYFLTVGAYHFCKMEINNYDIHTSLLCYFFQTAVLPLASHLTNYPSKSIKTYWPLLGKQGRTNQWCFPIDSYIWTH